MKMEDVRLALRRPPKRLKDSYSIICSQTIGSGEARPYVLQVANREPGDLFSDPESSPIGRLAT
jgi:hypothetical protein